MFSVAEKREVFGERRASLMLIKNDHKTGGFTSLVRRVRLDIVVAA